MRIRTYPRNTTSKEESLQLVRGEAEVSSEINVIRADVKTREIMMLSRVRVTSKEDNVTSRVNKMSTEKGSENIYKIRQCTGQDRIRSTGVTENTGRVSDCIDSRKLLTSCNTERKEKPMNCVIVTIRGSFDHFLVVVVGVSYCCSSSSLCLVNMYTTLNK